MAGSKISAGILMYRRRRAGGSGPQGGGRNAGEPAGAAPAGDLQVFLVHPGGPFFHGKDEGVWTIPKGLLEPGEEPLACAVREFAEEVGFRPEGSFFPLGQVFQKGGKTVLAWAVEMDPGDGIQVRSNTFRREWPPGSGLIRTFPEADRGDFFDLDTARRKINPAQAAFLDRLQERLGR